MAKRRRFTPEFKAGVVLKALSGESLQAELCRRHNLSAHRVFYRTGVQPETPHSAVGYLTPIEFQRQNLS